MVLFLRLVALLWSDRRRRSASRLSWKPDFISTLVCLQLPMESSPFVMPLPYCVYILFSCKDFLLYIGYTTNIEQRVKDHNCGKTNSTALRRPLKLIFCEFYLFETDARRREMYFKTTAGKKAIKLMLGATLLKFGYNRAAGIVVINGSEGLSP